MKALIFAAGLGTRLKELTQNTPKALVKVANKPLLQHAIEKLISFGINDITINVHHFAEQIIAFLSANNNFGITLHVSDEREQLLDTGGGLKKAAQYLRGSEPVLLYNVDVISDLNLHDLEKYHLKEQALATLVVRKRETSRYLMFDRNLLLTGWQNVSNGEKTIINKNEFANSDALAFSGIHIIQPGILDLITEEGKFSITDLYLRLARQYPIKAFVDHSNIWMDLGKPGQLSIAEKIIYGQ